MKTNKHEYSGAWAPPRDGSRFFSQSNTFSLGIFQWVAKDSGKGLRKTAVKVRVSGPTHTPETVYAKADEIVKALDAGTYAGPKNVTV